MTKTATIFGGTGFIGRHVVQRLAKAGYRVKVITRVPERAYFLKPCGTPGQVVPALCDFSAGCVGEAVRGSDLVINCVGILHEKKRREFKKLHVDLAQTIAVACRERGVARLIHISALGVDRARSRYARTKLEGERVVMAAFPAATILRPGVVFGPEDEFFNRFAALAQILPALPLIGGGKTKLQPVYVGDVADAVMKAAADRATMGQVYELGGSEILSFRQVYERLFASTEKRRTLIYLPFAIAKIQAGFLSLLPNPPLTPDQVETLKTDSIVAPGAKTLKDLGITPTGLDLVLAGYLEHYRPGGRFSHKKRA